MCQGGRPGFCGRKATLSSTVSFRAQELCESRGGRPGLPVPNSPHDLCGRKAATLNSLFTDLRSGMKDEVDVLGVPNSPHDLCGRKATLNSLFMDLRSGMKVDVDVLGSPSLIVRTVFVDVMQY